MTECARADAGKDAAWIDLANAAQSRIEQSERQGRCADQAEKLRAEDKHARVRQRSGREANVSKQQMGILESMT